MLPLNGCCTTLLPRADPGLRNVKRGGWWDGMLGDSMGEKPCCCEGAATYLLTLVVLGLELRNSAQPDQRQRGGLRRQCHARGAVPLQAPHLSQHPCGR